VVFPGVFPVLALLVIFIFLAVLTAGWMTAWPDIPAKWASCLSTENWHWISIGAGVPHARLQPIECLAARRPAPPFLLTQQNTHWPVGLIR
jgi:hypothetical protein